MWLRQEEIKGKNVLELGSGTALPGLLCARFGAEKVFLTDDAWQENTLKNIREAVKINNFFDCGKVTVEGLGINISCFPIYFYKPILSYRLDF